MGLNDTPGGSRFTIGIFGKRNAGKSSLINSLTGQSIALASRVPGTTTDPVYKAMELLPVGPVMLIDTAGLDDQGELGSQRVEKSMEALRKCHLVIYVADPEVGARPQRPQLAQQPLQLAQQQPQPQPQSLQPQQTHQPQPVDISDPGEKKTTGNPDNQPSAGNWDARNFLDKEESEFIHQLETRKIPYVIAVNQSGEDTDFLNKNYGTDTQVFTDAALKLGIDQLKKAIIRNSGETEKEAGLTDGLIEAGDLAVLVTPIDTAAPKGRMILPQQQVLRDILDKGAYTIVTREGELDQALNALGRPPKVVITDSQAFRLVDSIVPPEIDLTSFSILYARQKGDLKKMTKAAAVLGDLKPGDKVLIAEACTHHRQKDDIGTVKIPKMLRKLEPEVDIHWHSGASFPDDIREYKLVIHCGACMLNRPEVQYRIELAEKEGVPVTNYGLTIAFCTGILKRAVAPFGIRI
ncbi:[FeFe] hydrogenase H-cluster maturation GTPase HydF [Baileyella intestinalis]|uniref:[FeFe] hydrogenase H-cluster maturation GTPase HydF n=1 Tax=Baileyella intestinalis TaxID=2606709 RepID=UPI003899A804